MVICLPRSFGCTSLSKGAPSGRINLTKPILSSIKTLTKQFHVLPILSKLSASDICIFHPLLSSGSAGPCKAPKRLKERCDLERQNILRKLHARSKMVRLLNGYLGQFYNFYF